MCSTILWFVSNSITNHICYRVLLVEEPAFMEAGCGAMPEGMKSACCDLNPMDPACGGWVCGACLGLNTIDLAQCCRYV